MTSGLRSAVEEALARALGREARITSRAPLGGGSICQTERIETTAGSFVLKSLPTASSPSSPSSSSSTTIFEAEARGLVALRESGTPLTIPTVVAWSAATPAFLVIEYLAPARRVANFDDRLGEGLAEMHRATASRFGFDADNFCGATVQPNAWCDRWIEFYAVHRLGHQLRTARDRGHLSVTDATQVESLIARLGDWIDEPSNGPSLIHGDLWSGNLVVDARGGPALIDPAAYFAHREAELGMMTLFGGFSSRVFAAYDEAFPLEPGWRERLPVYELYHLMNHLNLFGGGYHAQVMGAVRLRA